MYHAVKHALIGTAAIAALAAPASAGTLFSGTPTGFTAAGTPIEYTFSVPDAPRLADIMFTLGAKGSVNGTNPDGTFTPVTDVFSFALNGSEVFRGSYALGGGGTNFTFVNTLGGTIIPTPGSNGGTLQFQGLGLLQGSNTLTFNFASTDPSEQFAVNSLEVTAAVPEPATWAMMLLGFFAVGAMMRSPARQRAMKVSYA
jgi:hypothetical protein